MASDKKAFMKSVTILIDSREQKNSHITDKLDEWGVKYETKKLDFADYSFVIAGRDFSQSCVVERKASIEELYGNCMEHNTDPNGNWVDVGGRIKKELEVANSSRAQLVLLLENCAGPDALKSYIIPEWKQKTMPKIKTLDIGKLVYTDVKTWQTANRYNFRVEYVADNSNSAARIIEEFYYYYNNFKKMIARR